MRTLCGTDFSEHARHALRAVPALSTSGQAEGVAWAIVASLTMPESSESNASEHHKL